MGEKKRMNIQIFGTNKSFDTKKAQRWFKERRIKFQMVDLKEKGLSRGEFDRVCQAVGGWQADRKSTRLNSSHDRQSRMPSSA